jgi:RecA-family ATPase
LSVANEVSKPSEWQLWTANSILEAEFGEDEWLIDSLLLKPGLMALSGNPGDFKTALALHFALCIARGLPVFNNFQTRQGTVLMVDEENHLRHIKKRFQALGLTQNDPILYLSQNGIKVDAPEMMSRIIELVKQHNVQLVTFDSFVDVHGQEENDSGGIQKVMSAMRQLVKEGVAVLFLHHPSKQVGYTPRKGGQNLRGSSNILAQVDTHMHVQKKDGEDVLVLRHEKMRDAAKLKPFEVKILLDGPAPTGFMYSELHDERQTKAQEAVQVIADVLQDGMQSRPQLHDLLTAEYGKGAIDDGIKKAEEVGLIERVPKEDLPETLTATERRQNHYRRTLSEEL